MLYALFKEREKREEIKYTLYNYQGKTIITIDQHRKVITNKSRQTGMSTVFAAYGLIDSSMCDESVLVVSPSFRQSKNLMNYAYQWMPILTELFKDDLKLIEETKTSIEFMGGGRFISLPNNPNTVRGFRAHKIIFDEFAHFLHGTDKEMWTAIFPSISRGGSVAANSTPFGTENLYYDIWNNLNNQYNDWKRVLINWQDCKDLDMSEILKQKEIDPLTYEQEYNNQFLEDVDEAEFPLSLIRKCIDMELEYKPLDKKKIYYVGIDIGRKRDLTAIAFFEQIKIPIPMKLTVQVEGEEPEQEDDLEEEVERFEKKFILRKVETHFNKEFRWQEEHIKQYLNNYLIEKMTIDAVGIGANIAENLRDDFGDYVKPLMIDSENKEVMVMDLKRMMWEGKFIIPNDPQVINNFRAIKRMYTAGGHLKFDSDRTSEIGHADLFWAIALALYRKHMGSAEFYIG